MDLWRATRLGFSIHVSCDGDGMRFEKICFHMPILTLGFALNVCAQQATDSSMPQMEMPMPAMATDAGGDFLREILLHDTSGTSAEPNSTPAPMLMKMAGGWMLMFHGNVFLVEQQQTSPQGNGRGGDKFFSTNWFMPMAQ